MLANLFRMLRRERMTENYPQSPLTSDLADSQRFPYALWGLVVTR